MKRMFLSLLMALSAIVLCQAEVVTADRALAVARDFVNQGGYSLKAGATLKLAHQARSVDGKPDYYVFNNGDDGGFIVVSGDDRTVPVWGYSTSGSFDYESLPDNAKWLFGEYQRQLQYLRDHPEVKARKPVKLNTRVGPLLTTKWDQCYPYNKRCPFAYGGNDENQEHALTGCGPTAVAQIMRFHKWPKVGIGSNRYTSEVTQYVPYPYDPTGALLHEEKYQVTMSANFANSYYNWDLMQNNYTDGNTYTIEQIDEVAKLMYDLGIASEVEYGARETESTVGGIINAVSKHFEYDYTGNQRANFNSVEEWDELLRQQLDEQLPIIYSADDSKSGSGHAFIFDGYDEDGRFSVNWGWGGVGDNYYYSYLLTVESYDFSVSQQALVLTPLRNEKSLSTQLTGRRFGTVNTNSQHTASLSVVGQNLDQDVSISLSGANAGMFSVVNSVSAADANADGGKTVKVVYNPTASGDHTALLTVNAGDGIDPVTYTLTGTSCLNYDANGDDEADIGDVVAAIQAVLNNGSVAFSDDQIDIATIVAMIGAILDGETNIDLNDGLVAYYPFDGDARDASGNGNHGEVHDLWATHGVNGDTNGAWHFGGYSHPGYIRISNSQSLQFTDGFTFACYVKPLDWAGMDGWGSYSSNGAHCIFAKDHDRRGPYMNIGLTGNSNMQVNTGTGGSWYHQTGWANLYSNDKIEGNKLNEWVHVAITYSKKKARMYIDGMLVDQREITADFTEMNRNDLYLGKFSDYWFPFNGVMDEVRIYNRMLTADEIKNLAADNVVTQEEKHPFKLSQKSVTLAVGESVTIEMLNGSGSYSVGCNSNIVDYTLDRESETITLKGIAEGTTNVTVIDVNSQTTIMLPVTVTEREYFNGQIVMERKYLLQHANQYNYMNVTFQFDNNTTLTTGYYDSHYWDGSYYNHLHGIHIISAKDGWYHDPQYRTHDWYVAPIILGEWVDEKVIINHDGRVKYYINNEYMGEELFDKLDLERASTVIVDIDPWGWWTGQKHYTDDFKITTSSSAISDNFNDGVIDLNIWQAPVNPDGVREEDGILKTEQLRTDQDFHLRSKPIKL